MKPVRTFRGVVLKDRAQTRSSSHAKQPVSAASAAARARVGREVAGRGGKAVTVITGLPLDEVQLAELATRLKKLCGAGGAVKNGIIEIQGDHRDRLVAELCKLGLEAKRAGG